MDVVNNQSAVLVAGTGNHDEVFGKEYELSEDYHQGKYYTRSLASRDSGMDSCSDDQLLSSDMDQNGVQQQYVDEYGDEDIVKRAEQALHNDNYSELIDEALLSIAANKFDKKVESYVNNNDESMNGDDDDEESEEEEDDDEEEEDDEKSVEEDDDDEVVIVDEVSDEEEEVDEDSKEEEEAEEATENVSTETDATETKIDSKDDLREELQQTLEEERIMTINEAETQEAPVTEIIQGEMEPEDKEEIVEVEEENVDMEEPVEDKEPGVEAMEESVQETTEETPVEEATTEETALEEVVETGAPATEDAEPTPVEEPATLPPPKNEAPVEVEGPIAPPNDSSRKLFENLLLRVSLFDGHHHDVCAVDVFGNFVLSGGRDTSLKLWIKSPQQEFKSLGGHDGTITALAFMKDKEHERYPPAISGSFDCSFKTWNLEKGELMKSVYTYSPVLALDYADGVALIGTEAGKVEMYNVDSGECVYSVIAHNEPVTAVRFLSDGKVVSGSVDGTVKIFDSKAEGSDPLYASNITKLDVSFADNAQTTEPAVEGKPTPLSKISCITTWKGHVIYGNDGYNLKVWNVENGSVTKLRNNLHEFCPTEAVCVTTIKDEEFLLSAGSDVDTGDSYINVRSLPDFNYVGTIRDTASNSGHITCLSSTESDTGLEIISGGTQLRGWSQAKRARKRKGTEEPESLIPCKFICNYTEKIESELDSDCESSATTRSTEKSTTSTDSKKPSRWGCAIM